MIDSISYIISCALVGVISFALYRFLNENLDYWKKLNVSGPKPMPFIGSRYFYFIKPMPDVEIEWYQKYGKIFGLYNGNKPVISVAEPELIKQILVQDFNEFRNRTKTIINLHPIWERTMFFTRDEEWKRVRTISSPAFTSGKLKRMLPLINYCCKDFVSNLDEYAKNNKEIDVKKLHGAYTMDVIAKCAFAANTNSHKDPDNEFIKNGRQLINIKPWKIIMALVLPSFISENEKFTKFLNVAYDTSEFFVEISRKLITQRKNNQTEKYNDFLQLLIDAERNDELLNQSDNNSNYLNGGKNEKTTNTNAFINVAGKKLTENEIIAQCVIFFLAGYETTSSTLTYCSYELSLYPEVQKKLYEEIKTAFGDGQVDYEILVKLPYLDAVISETLRKYPPVLRLERQAMNGISLGDTGITIPKGMMAEIPVYAIHYDPENYENPLLFNPERFMPENRSNIKPYTYLPFGTGPRNCIGMRFALLEVKLAIVNMVRHFILFKNAKTIIPMKFKKGRLNGLFPEKLITIGIKRRY